jgi:transposase
MSLIIPRAITLRQARRLLALAAIYDGGKRTEAARLGNVTLQIVLDWVVRFNTEGPEGPLDRKASGPRPVLTDAHRQALAAQIDSGPIPAVHGVVRWRLCDLGHWLWQAFGISVSVQTLSRELRAMGYRRLSARPRHHAQAEGAIEAFKKLPRHAGGHRARAGLRSWRNNRGLVRGRSAHRAEEWHHPPLGAARHPTFSAAGPALRFDPHLRRCLPAGGQGRGPGAAIIPPLF